MPHSTHMANGDTQATPQTEALHMYTLQYRFKQVNGRYTKWFKVSDHEQRTDAKIALGAHVAEFWSMSARVIDNTGRVYGEYKYIDRG